jgi:hypothetical protein
LPELIDRGCLVLELIGGLDDDEGEVFDFASSGRPCRIAGETPLAGFEELFRPAVIQALSDTFPAAEFGNRGLATQAVEDDADLLFG